MAVKKISQLTETTTVADNDYVAILQTATTSTKKIQKSNLIAGVSPSGMVTAYAGNAVPSGWLMCNGQQVSRTTYTALFSAIGVLYGVGDGSSTFNVPNLSGNVIVGVSGTDASFNAVAKTGGEKNHQLNTGEMPSHSHGVYDPGHSHSGGALYFMDAGGNGNLNLSGGGDRYAQGQSPLYINGSGTGIGIYGSGGDQPHNNLQPYVTLNYIIKI